MQKTTHAASLFRRDTLEHWISYAVSLRGEPRTFGERADVQCLAIERAASALRRNGVRVTDLDVAHAMAPIFAESFPNSSF